MGTLGAVYWLTGSVESALEIGGIEFVLKFVMYYGHERMWESDMFLRMGKPLVHPEE